MSLDERTRHEKFWAFAQIIDKPLMKILYNLEAEKCEYSGPALVIANHSNDLDPLILAACFPKNQMYFVASEHIFRLGYVSKLLSYLVAPIPRKKASSGADTVKACLRNLKAGNSVALMAEGEATWDGRSIDAFSATGKLAKSSGASLITVRIHGAYLSKPRWANGNRRGKVTTEIVHVYSPSELADMSASEVQDAINRDIFEDCWARQKESPVEFSSDKRAEHIERAVFMCPKCKGIGTIHSSGNFFHCDSCDFKGEVTRLGTFSPASPFENVAQWDEWQKKQIGKKKNWFFCDDDVTITEIPKGHEEVVLGTSCLTLNKGVMKCGNISFNVSEISNMSMVQARRLLISYNGSYYELKANGITSLRKYLMYWQSRTSEDK